MSWLRYLMAVLCIPACFAVEEEAATTTFTLTETQLEQRALYEQALDDLRHGRNISYVKAKRKLRDYPLYPYLEYGEIATPIRYWNRSKINKFIAKYDGQPISSYLYRRWLDYLIRGDRWQAYLKDYKGSTTTSHQCYHALANYRNGNKTQAYEDGVALWNVGKSQPKGCDKLFAVLMNNKKITEDIAWQRFQAAYPTRNSKLLRYLGRFFTSKSYKRSYDNYMTLRGRPHLLNKYFDFEDDSDNNREALTYVLKRYGSTDPKQAQRHWVKYRKQFSFSPEQSEDIGSAIVKGLMKKDLDKQADGLLKQLSHPKLDLLESRLRAALEAQDWSSVRFWISKLPETEQSSQRWRYWLARAETAMTDGAALKDHALIEPLSKERGFYSFIAADEVDTAYEFEYQPTAISEETVTAIKNNAGLARARELHAFGRQTEATREWYAATQHFSKAEWEASGVAFHEWGWPYLAILSMTKAQSWQDIVVRFPVLHESHYRKEAKAQQLPPHLLMAITRQESAFNEKAVSSADARGLMQLLPSTAKYIAKKRKIDYSSTRKLLEPEKNIALGSAYYRYLMDQFGDNRPLSIASYNAGPHRVKKWLKKTDDPLPMDIWIETIPFKETRRYVQNVDRKSVV